MILESIVVVRSQKPSNHYYHGRSLINIIHNNALNNWNKPILSITNPFFSSYHYSLYSLKKMICHQKPPQNWNFYIFYIKLFLFVAIYHYKYLFSFFVLTRLFSKMLKIIIKSQLTQNKNWSMEKLCSFSRLSMYVWSQILLIQ